MTRDNINTIHHVIHWWENVITQLVKVLHTRKEDQVVDFCLPFSLCLHSVRECADDLSCLREQGVKMLAI